MLSVYVVTAGMFVEGDRHFIIHNLFHMRGDGHLWTISQELLFYALTPPIVFFMSRLRSPALAAAVLLAVAWLSAIYLIDDVFSLPAIGNYSRFYLAPFLLGMAAAYLLPHARQFARSRQFRRVGANAIAIILVATAISILAIEAANSLVVDDDFAYDHIVLLPSLFAVIIVWLAESPRNWLSEIFSLRPLRAIGIVGYSFYLWHWIALVYIPQEWPAMLCFIVATVATFSAAWATFHLVERPGVACGAWLAGRLLGRPPASSGWVAHSTPSSIPQTPIRGSAAPPL